MATDQDLPPEVQGLHDQLRAQLQAAQLYLRSAAQGTTYGYVAQDWEDAGLDLLSVAEAVLRAHRTMEQIRRAGRGPDGPLDQ